MSDPFPSKVTPEQHISKANANETFALSLDLIDQAKIDWAITALFYSALHHVQAYFIKRRSSIPELHTQRDSQIRRDALLRPIYHDYSTLKKRSRTVRYEVWPTFKETEVARMYERLTNIKSTIGSLI